MLTELVTFAFAFGAFVSAIYGLYIARKWDRKVDRLTANPQALWASLLHGAQSEELQEVACKVLTASFLNAIYVMMNKPEVMAKLEGALEKYGPSLAQSAARGYVEAQKDDNPGRALQAKRWNRSGAGKNVVASLVKGDTSSVWDTIGEKFMEQMLPRLLGGGGGGAGSGPPQQAAHSGAQTRVGAP